MIVTVRIVVELSHEDRAILERIALALEALVNQQQQLHRAVGAEITVGPITEQED